MVHSRGARASNFEVILTQVLQGAGGGVAAISLHVGAQASVTHTDIAMVIAVVLLVTEIGAAAGSAGGTFSESVYILYPLLMLWL